MIFLQWVLEPESKVPHIDLRWITTQLELTRSTSCADTAKSFLRRTVDGIATMFARQECTLIVDGSRKRSYIFQRMEYDHGTRIAVRHGWVDNYWANSLAGINAR